MDLRSGKTLFIKQFELFVINNYDENGIIVNQELKINDLAFLQNISGGQINDQINLREYFEVSTKSWTF